MIKRYTFYIYPHEVDCTKHATMTAVGAYVLNAAGLAAAENHFGMNDMHARGLAWVVSRLAIEMREFPKEYETIDVETWVADCGRMASTRHFRIYGSGGDVIGEATSLWSMIDITTRRPVDLREKTNLSSFIEEGEAVCIAKPRKVAEPGAEASTVRTHTVAYSDIDMNRHANSMKYLQWVLDTYPLERFEAGRIARCDINYSHEVRYGEKISAVKEETVGAEGRELHLFDIRNGEGRTCCRIAIEWV